MFSEYGLPVIFLQGQDHTDIAMLISSGLAALAAAGSAVAAFLSYRSAESPLVVAHLFVDDDNDEVFFKVENIGKSPAYGITIEPSDPISPFPEEMETLGMGFIGRGIPMLAPGDKRVTEITDIDEYVKVMRGKQITVRVRYYSGARKLWFQKRKGDFVIDAYSFIGFKVDSFEKRATLAVERIASALSTTEDDGK